MLGASIYHLPSYIFYIYFVLYKDPKFGVRLTWMYLTNPVNVSDIDLFICTLFIISFLVCHIDLNIEWR